MTASRDFDRTVATWLHAEAGDSAPDYLEEIVVRVAQSGQRPAWSIPERWIPMNITMRASTLVPVRAGRLLLVGAIIVALIGLAIIAAGSRHPVPPPFGPARNGDFVFGADGDIFRFDPVTAARTPLIAGPEWDFGAGFSRDGTKFNFGRLEHDPSVVPDTDQTMIVMIANADGSNVRALTPALPGTCWSDWSPDGRQLVIRTERPDHYGLLTFVDVETGTIRTIDPGTSVRCGPLAYRPPDGAEIVFRGDTDTDHGIFAIHPDGTGLRRVNTARRDCECDTGALSHDGRYLAVDRWDDNGFVRLWLLDVAAGTERRLATPPGTFARGGTFSPDGTLIAFPMLHRVGADQNAYTVGIAPVDGRTPARSLGPEMTLPANGSDEAGVSIAFSPDGKILIAGYDATPTPATGTIWLLPVDGTPGRSMGTGVFAALDIQRRAP